MAVTYLEDVLCISLVLGEDLEHVPETEQLDGGQQEAAALRLEARASLYYELLHRQGLARDTLFVVTRRPA